MGSIRLNLGELTKSQLIGLRQVLTTGNLAVADSKEVNKLRKENAQLKKLNARRKAVEAESLDWDSEYWMSFDDGAFTFFLNLFAEKKRQAEKEIALSEKTYSMKVPPIIAERELNALDTVRAGFGELRNKKNGHEH